MPPVRSGASLVRRSRSAGVSWRSPWGSHGTGTVRPQASASRIFNCPGSFRSGWKLQAHATHYTESIGNFAQVETSQRGASGHTLDGVRRGTGALGAPGGRSDGPGALQFVLSGRIRSWRIRFRFRFVRRHAITSTAEGARLGGSPLDADHTDPGANPPATDCCAHGGFQQGFKIRRLDRERKKEPRLECAPGVPFLWGPIALQADRCTVIGLRPGRSASA